MALDKTVADASTAVEDIVSGSSIAVGGFGLCGVPSALIKAVLAHGARDLEVVSNNAGVDGYGLGMLLKARRLRRVIASYVGENKEFERQYLSGELELELTPQGTLAERLRAGGAGIPGFYTMTGAGTLVAEGGIPLRYHLDGGVAEASKPKPLREFSTFGQPRDYVLEEAIVTDFALVRAAVGDRHGNLVFHASARNFNPVAAMAGRITVAEVEELVEPGEIPADSIHLPGVYVHRVVELSADERRDKRIEKTTTRSRS